MKFELSRDYDNQACYDCKIPAIHDFARGTSKRKNVENFHISISSDK